MLDAIHRLIDHLEWADRRALEALRAAGEPPADALAIYAHVVGAEHVWLSRLRRIAPEHAVWPDLGLEGCAALARENVQGLRDHLRGLDSGNLHAGVPYRNSAGDAFESTTEDILLHLAMHGSYHRGQVAMLLRRAGAEPAATDYIAFTRGAPAAVRRDPEAGAPGGPAPRRTT